MNANPILVEVWRGEKLESFHRGVVCVVNREGKVIYSEGDIQQICYPRSALKYFQVLPLLESDAADHFGFTTEEIAVMCGSHNGESEHLRVVSSILEKAGIDKSYLNCGPQYPTHKKDIIPLYKKDLAPEHIHNNCSGKHAGFLAMSKFLNADLRSYLEPEHPVQKLIKTVASEMYEYPEEQMHTAVDGCSAPIFSIPVYNQALAYMNLVHPNKFSETRTKACKRVVDAISSYPFMVAGSQRYCTDLMEKCGNKIVGKTGAEGVYCLSVKDTITGCAIKIDDGKMLPQYNVAQKFVEATGLIDKDVLASLEHYLSEPLKNYNKIPTGKISVRKDLFENMQSDPLV